MSSTSSISSIATERPTAPLSSRLISLDVMRGITVAFMIMVNNNGQHAYHPFNHSAWNGWTLTDLVFPTFLFLMGTSIVFSTESRLRRGESKSLLLVHTLRRFAILFLLGLVVNGFPFFHLGTLRIYGVLQRIAICFLVGSILYLWDRRVWTKVVLVVIALAGYWALMRLVPVPGHGLPGRDIPLLDKDLNLAAYLDRHIFPGRLYEVVRDPEGFLSTLPSLGTTLLGMLTGMWLRTQKSLEEKLTGMLTSGLICLLLGEIWNIWFPINKKLWTSSYVLFAAGCTLVAFALCYWAVEIKGWKKGWTYFWLVFGTNTITAYVFSELLSTTLAVMPVRRGLSVEHWIYFHMFTPIQPAGIGALVYSICFMVVCWLPVAALYRRKIFIKI